MRLTITTVEALPRLALVASIAILIAVAKLPASFTAGFPFTFLCCLIEGFFVPFHWGFVFDRVPVSCPYRKVWLRLAFPFEIISVLGVLFISEPLKMPFREPFGLPVFEYLTKFHAAGHVFHTFYAVFVEPPALHVKQPTLAEIAGRIWVTLDAIVHTAVVLRLATVANAYELIFAGIAWLSILRTVDHQWFLLDYEKKKATGRKRGKRPAVIAVPAA